jgi:hypothetical protein
VVGRALDHQQQQVALRGQARGAGVAFGGAQELAQRGAKFCDRGDVSGGELVGDGRILVAEGLDEPTAVPPNPAERRSVNPS